MTGVSAKIESWHIFISAEQHEERLRKMRELQNLIQEDDWMYSPADINL